MVLYLVPIYSYYLHLYPATIIVFIVCYFVDNRYFHKGHETTTLTVLIVTPITQMKWLTLRRIIDSLNVGEKVLSSKCVSVLTRQVIFATFVTGNVYRHLSAACDETTTRSLTVATTYLRAS